MAAVEPVVRPRRRLWRTLFRHPRPLGRFASPITFAEATRDGVELSEAAHWGEVCLLEDCALVLHRDATVTISHHEISVLSGAANLAAWDEMTSAYHRRLARMSFRTTRAYLPDGTILNAARVVQRLQQSTPNAPNEVITVAFPHLRPGTILDWDVQTDEYTPNEFGPGVWGNYYLQTNIPCRRRRITIAIAEPFAATVQLHNGAIDPAESDVGPYHVFCWDLRNVPAFEVDSWVPPPRDFGPWIDVSTFTSWQPIANHLRRDVDSSEHVPPQVSQLRHELTQAVQVPVEKLARIHQFMSRDVRYGRHPHEVNMSKTREMGGMLVDLRGDCKDKCGMMVAMLRELSIPAAIAVLLTRDLGIQPFLPSMRFNHAVVVAHVDGQEFWLDPAAGPFTFGEIPFPDQGVRALVLERPLARITEVPPAKPEHHLIDRVSRGTLELDGAYQCETVVTAMGDRAAAIRDALFHHAEQHRQTLMAQSVAANHPGATVGNITIDHVDDVSQPPRYRYTVHLPAWARCIEELMILRIPWFEPIVWEGLFTPVERSVPLVTPHVGSVSEFHMIQIPEEFSGYGLPLERIESCPWATYRNEVAMDDGQLLCKRHVQFLGGIVSPQEFGGFRRYWESCARWDQEDIVLRKN